MVTLAHTSRRGKLEDKLKVLLQQGFFLLDDKMIRLDEIDQHSQDKKDITLIIDRIVKEEEDFTTVWQMRYKLPL
jgi:excinuclease UvrABC ATPase subunit